MKDIEAEFAKTRQTLEALKAEYEEFVYVVSHDFSAPFRQIEAFTKLIAERYESQFDDKARTHLHYMMQSTKKGQSMLSSLLEFSRLAQTDSDFEAVTLTTLVDAAKQRLAQLIEQTSATIHSEHDALLQADAEQIERVFYLLLHNALLYRKADVAPNIVIRSEEIEGGWQCSISDNGIGITPNQADRAFTLLCRCVTDEKTYPGEGMGLPIARKIIRRHGGKIWFGPNGNEGATIHFTLMNS